MSTFTESKARFGVWVWLEFKDLCQQPAGVKLLEKRLSDYGISLTKDVVCICTDGASVMVKFGKLVPCEHQLCLAHGIQLAVLDTLYKRKKLAPMSEDNQENVNENDSDQDDDNVDPVEEDDGLAVLTREESDAELAGKFSPLIEKIRKVVRMFKRSPTKTDLLQKYVCLEDGGEMFLLLDCKTRWSSLFTMLERFYLLKTSIQKSLIDLHSDISFSEVEFTCISDITSSLEVVKLTVEALCRRDADLVTADSALKFMFNELDSQHSVISDELSKSLKLRIEQRRRPELSGVLQYLQDPTPNQDDSSDDLFVIPSKARMRTIIHNISKRLVNPNPEAESDSEGKDTSAPGPGGPGPSTTPMSMKEKLQLAIDKGHSASHPVSTNLAMMIRREMTLFEDGGVRARGRHLQSVHNFLLTIPPTSVEAERAFSSAGLICTKLRSRLNDSTLDSLCFLRFFFQHKKP